MILDNEQEKDEKKLFVEIAVKEPNLFHFLNLNKNKSKSEDGFGAILTKKQCRNDDDD